MALEEKTRSEIEDKYKWDLSTIYKDSKVWYEDYEKAKKILEEIPNYKDKFLKSGKEFYEYLKFDEKLDRLINKLYCYANLNYDVDTLNDDYKVMLNKITDLLSKYSELSSFVTPSILKLDKEDINDFYDDEPKLEDYRFIIEDIYRFKAHTLDEEKERMLSSLSKCFSYPEDTYTSLIYSDISFGKIEDETGNKVELTESNYSLYIRSKNRNVRKRAFEKLFNKYESFKNTIASCFAGNVEQEIVGAKLRNYESAILSSLHDDNVNISIYDNLIKVVNDNLDVLYKYYELKKSVLNLDELHLYDTYVELIGKTNKKYEFDEAKEMVLDSLSVLGEDYVSILNKAFNEKWIDIYHNKGKTTGAYSSGFYDTNPFVLLNYEGTLEDVSTLAHELGHSLHTYYSCKNNPYQYSNYKIFVAEVASTVNELLLLNYLLKKSNNKEEKLQILNSLMELIKATLFRQTMFAEFEKDMHEKREQGEVLTSTYLSASYYELVKKYFGSNVIVDDLIKYEWERIPHFYYNFYVYKYATGISAACYIASGILNNKENIKEDYIKFLSSGGSNYPIEELKIAGVDMNDENVIKSAIDMFSSYIEEFKKLYNNKEV